MPRNLFIEMEKRHEGYPLLLQEKKLAVVRADYLSLALLKKTETTTVALDRVALWRGAYEAERQDRRESDEDVRRAAQRDWHESRALWFAVGVVSAVGVFLAVANLVPDRVLAPGG